MDSKAIVVPGWPDPAKMRLAVDRLTLPGPDGKLRLRDSVSPSLACSVLIAVCVPAPGKPSWAPHVELAEQMKVLEERSRRMSVASTGWHITEPDVAPQQAHCSPEQEKNVARLVAARAATRAATANLVQCAKRLADIIDDNKKAFLDMAMVELEGFVRQSLGIPDDFDFPEDPDTPEDAE